MALLSAAVPLPYAVDMLSFTQVMLAMSCHSTTGVACYLGM